MARAGARQRPAGGAGAGGGCRRTLCLSHILAAALGSPTKLTEPAPHPRRGPPPQEYVEAVQALKLRMSVRDTGGYYRVM